MLGIMRGKKIKCFAFKSLIARKVLRLITGETPPMWVVGKGWIAKQPKMGGRGHFRLLMQHWIGLGFQNYLWGTFMLANGCFGIFNKGRNWPKVTTSYGCCEKQSIQATIILM